MQQTVIINSNKNDCFWAAVCHLSALLGYVIPFLGHLLGPLIVWSMKRQQSEYINAQGKEALNFQITVTLYYMVASALILVLIGIFLLPLLAILNFIFIIIAAISAYGGEAFRYPFTIRWLR